ncbi:DUF6438 domain-containing protein [Saccharicrinis aurantiacus]|uniref:DUF6438 domain-containing protein n=1 Tax=Saccharicrinis aurantiacus TaxID=1849719 RepID=UPI00249373BF|nr:DUF6438 domain-containing protein [Saccharicrinis aurantiacus]
MRYIQLTLILVLMISCSNQKQINKGITSIYWNLHVNYNDSNLLKFKDQALYFKKGVSYFFDNKIANYSISNDTIIICDTSYYKKWIVDKGISSVAKVETKFHEVINDDSLYRVTYKYLVGKIKKVDSDSLVIEKIEGFGFPFKYQDVFRFYNDTYLYDKDLRVDTIEFSNSLCYGNCPAIAMKIDKGLNFDFWGGKYSDKKGFRKGVITNSQFNQLESLIRIANIENNITDFYPPVDAPYVEIIIDYNNNKTKRFWGYVGDFPVRLKNVALEMFELYKTSSLDSCGCKLTFEVELDIPEKRVPPPPPPEEILKVFEDVLKEEVEIDDN